MAGIKKWMAWIAALALAMLLLIAVGAETWVASLANDPAVTDTTVAFPGPGYPRVLNLIYFLASIGLLIAAVVGFVITRNQLRTNQIQLRVQSVLDYYAVWSSSRQNRGRRIAKKILQDAKSVCFAEEKDPKSYRPTNGARNHALTDRCETLIVDLQRSSPLEYRLLLDVLTFLEHVGYMLDRRLVSIEDLVRLYGGELLDIELAVAGWIVKVRDQHDDDRIFENFETMCRLVHDELARQGSSTRFVRRICPGWTTWRRDA
jgi:hypothetical protein